VIIPKEELANFQRWQAGSFDKKPAAPAVAPAPAPPPVEEPVQEAPVAAVVDNAVELPTADDVERIRAAAHAAGYAAGLAEGRMAGEQQARDSALLDAQHFNTLIGNLKLALDEVDQSVADELLSLALEVAAQLTRGTIAAKADVLLPIIREAVTTLPLHHGHIVLRLNPGDAAHVRSLLGEEFAQTGTQILEDNAITPGGCLLEAGASEIDATIETRWKRVLEAIGTEPREWLIP